MEMKKRNLQKLLILFLLLFIISIAYAKVPDIVLNQKKAVVTIYINDKEGKQITTGTGFIIDQNGIIATNYHVIEKWLETLESTLLVKMENGAYFPIENLINFDEDNDVALFKVEAKELPIVKLATDYKSKQGEGVIVIGSPLGLETTVSDGIISNVRGKGGLIQITAPISPGSSGSPIFNSKGEIIGVATFLIQGGQNLNFAIPVKHVANLINESKKPKKERFIPLTEQPTSSKDKEHLSKINPEVQLKDNGYLKILDEYIELKTPEEVYKNNDMMIKQHKDMVKMGLENEKIRWLKVKIQFLKPCKATTKFDEYMEKYPLSGDDEPIPLEGEEGACIKYLLQLAEAQDKGEKMPYGPMSKCDNITDYIFPQFRCDYRYKVFLTTFRSTKFKEYESSDFGIFPSAPSLSVINNKINYKEEMLPGETMWITFYLGNATSWYAWVPK